MKKKEFQNLTLRFAIVGSRLIGGFLFLTVRQVSGAGNTIGESAEVNKQSGGELLLLRLRIIHFSLFILPPLFQYC